MTHIPRPATATNLEMIVRNCDQIMADYVAITPGISHSSALHILTQELVTRKISVRWILKLLTNAQICIQFSISWDNLCWFEENPTDFLNSSLTSVTINETNQEQKQFKHWLTPSRQGNSWPEILRCWWNLSGGFSSTGQYYATLWQLQCNVITKCCGTSHSLHGSFITLLIDSSI